MSAQVAYENKLSPSMRGAIDHAIKHSGGNPDNAVLVRFPGGFWSNREWKLHQGTYWGTTTIEAIVRRGAGEYVKHQTRKDGSTFPIEMKVTL